MSILNLPIHPDASITLANFFAQGVMEYIPWRKLIIKTILVKRKKLLSSRSTLKNEHSRYHTRNEIRLAMVTHCSEKPNFKISKLINGIRWSYHVAKLSFNGCRNFFNKSQSNVRINSTTEILWFTCFAVWRSKQFSVLGLDHCDKLFVSDYFYKTE